jgi:hypothetical protein
MHAAADRWDWARQAGTTALLQIHARPGARVTALVGLHGGRLRVAINAPPVAGKANDALLDFLAQVLRRPRSTLQLHSGSTHREKCVRIEAADAAEIARQLQERLPAPRK